MTDNNSVRKIITCNGCGRSARITCDEGVVARMINLSCVCGTMTEAPSQAGNAESPTTPGNVEAPGTGPLLTGSPAFPVRGHDMLGLTKREWFAGMAMQGIAHGVGDGDQRRIARWSVACADALIAALGDTQPTP